MRRDPILVLCAALIATVPLLLNGDSCGHDFVFHTQSWLDAAEQLRHGTLLPHWTFSSAYNAGEPRFLFYPPLSWMLGATLTLIFPIALVPTLYTFLILSFAGLAMLRLARHFAPPNAAVFAAILYVANPYMLFTAYERSAYAELLAAAWLPLLLLAALRLRPTITGIALPIALLWLTNAPAAVMGCYVLAFLFATRLIFIAKSGAERLHLAITATAGTALGLALGTFYLIPAAYERRFVQIAMAIIPGMRFQDNFLFGHTGDGPHDAVLHTASLIAITLLALTFASLATLWLRSHRTRATHNLPALSITALALAIALLVTPLSAPIWAHFPDLAFLQFPWRILAVLAVVLALSLAVALLNLNRLAAPIALAMAAALTFASIHNFRQGCEAEDRLAFRAQAFRVHAGFEPTDEYTPTSADNDALRSDDPPVWLSPDPAAIAPGSKPNPAAQPATEGETADPRPVTASLPPTPVAAPFTVAIDAPKSEFLILNLRQYPSWRFLLNDQVAQAYTEDPRDDGLTVLAVPRGHSTLQIAWHRTLDQQIGIALSVFAATAYVALILRTRSRRIEA